MSYESIVYRILIASPSDVEEEREVVARIIQDWNDLNSFNKKIVLLPVKWETHSSPTYGVRPQEAINKQLVDDCDLLIGFFWTKIGTPTGEEIGGTIEEIKRVSKAGKPVMLYFSKRGKDPSLIDLEQLQSLTKFKEEVYTTALVETFNSIVDFRDKLSRQLEMKIRELQDQKEDNKKLISFSFINSKTEEETYEQLKLSIGRIEIDKNERIRISNDERITDKSYFEDTINEYLNKKNNIPIILGLKNNLNRILANINVELKLKSSESNSLTIQTFNSHGQSINTYRLDNLITDDIKRNISKIFNDNHTQTSDTSWEVDVKPFTLLPNKLKAIESFILLYPKKSQKIEFSIILFSDNILKPIENKIVLDVDLKKRKITENEITEMIELHNEDDFPF